VKCKNKVSILKSRCTTQADLAPIAFEFGSIDVLVLILDFLEVIAIYYRFR
jgi:hypothetical protein